MKLVGKKTVGFLSVAILACCATAQAAERKEGNWEVRVNMEMVGMPMKMPPQTVNQCVTKKDLVPDMSQRDQNCIVKEQKVVGDTVTWKMQCSGKQGTMDGEGRIKYGADSYDGDMSMNIVQPGAPAMSIKYAMHGKWTGPCSAESKKAKRADDY
jgi:hypothetical protein